MNTEKRLFFSSFMLLLHAATANGSHTSIFQEHAGAEYGSTAPPELHRSFQQEPQEHPQAQQEPRHVQQQQPVHQQKRAITSSFFAADDYFADPPPPPPSQVNELDLATWDVFSDLFVPSQQQQQQQKSQSGAPFREREDPKDEEKKSDSSLLPAPHISTTPIVDPGSTAAEKNKISLVPPRLWLVAFLASGCIHCRRLRPMLSFVQRSYFAKLKRLRAARRRAFDVVVEEATAQVFAADFAAAQAKQHLLRLNAKLSGRKDANSGSQGSGGSSASGAEAVEEIIKAAEAEAVAAERARQAIQKRVVQQAVHAWEAAATAAWVYADVVFAAFDCTGSEAAQFFCVETLKISRFPTVLLLRRLPKLAEFASAAAAAAAEGGADPAAAASAAATESQPEPTFATSPLLATRGRPVDFDNEQEAESKNHAAAAVEATKTTSPALLLLQSEQLAEFFLPLTQPTASQLLLFLFGAAAEVATWAPRLSIPSALVRRLLQLPQKVSSSADFAAVSSVAAYAAENSNSFVPWLRRRMRGEAVREVLSAEEAKLLHWGSTATTAAASSSSCSSPSVSFFMCVDLQQILAAESTAESNPMLGALFQQAPQGSQNQLYQRQRHQQKQREGQQQEPQKGSSQENKQQWPFDPAENRQVKVDGLRAAFVTYAAAARVLRLQHLFFYSFNTEACTAQHLLVSNNSGAANVCGDEVPVLNAFRAGSPRHWNSATFNSNSCSSDKSDKRPAVQVVALQPALLLEEDDEESQELNKNDFPCSGSSSSSRGTVSREQRKLMILKQTLEGIWATQQQQRHLTPAFQGFREVQHCVSGEAENVMTKATSAGRDERTKCNLKEREQLSERCRLEKEGEECCPFFFAEDTEERSEQDLQDSQQRKQQKNLQGHNQCCTPHIFEETVRRTFMQQPVFLGPFPPQLGNSKDETASPFLASFIDFLRFPTLQNMGQANFLQLRLAGSASWLAPNSSSSSKGCNGGSAGWNLVLTALDLRVLEQLLSWDSLRLERLIRHVVEKQHLQQHETNILAGPSKPTKDDNNSVESFADPSIAPWEKSSDVESSAAVAAFSLLVQQLWQLSETARETLLLETCFMSHGATREERRIARSRNNTTARVKRDSLCMVNSKFIFAFVDAFRFSEGLADYDVNAHEDGELPAVVAFDPLLPPSSIHKRSSRRGGSSIGSVGSRDGTTNWERQHDSRFVVRFYRDRRRLTLKELHEGINLLRLGKLRGRVEGEEEGEEEQSEKSSSSSFIWTRLYSHLKRLLRRSMLWATRKLRAASHSKIALVQLLFGLFALSLLLFCSIILLLHILFSRPNGQEDLESDEGTEAVEEVEDEESEETNEDDRDEDRPANPATASEKVQHEREGEGTSGHSTTFEEEAQTVEEVRRRAEKELRKRR